VVDAAELQAWLRLLLVPGLGREGARRLLAAFGSPDRVINASEDALVTVAGAGLLSALAQEPADLQQRVDDVQRWLSGGPSRHVLTLGEPAYPPRLLESPDPPLLLYVTGDLSSLAAPSIAVVGSRRPSAQGRDNARDFAHCFGAAGYVVVSGLALGIDAAAHEAALAAGARTVAVMGTGPDRVYPARHLALARRIADQGALVTEFVPGTAPLRENFPMRNRVIAGLSQGTLVVEAALQSGSLITARLANEAGREVFAIPGSIHSEQSRGCHALIRDGARLVESATEVLDELRQPGLPGWSAARGGIRTPAAPADPLLEALGHDPMSLDSLQARTGQSASEMLSRLLELELEGQVARLPGGLYQRRVST
jgi:DNA processing protein